MTLPCYLYSVKRTLTFFLLFVFINFMMKETYIKTFELKYYNILTKQGRVIYCIKRHSK